MKHLEESPIARLEITLENGTKMILDLFRDVDAYRWYQQADGADTEVSGATVGAAIDAATQAWRDYAPGEVIQ